MQFEKLNRRMAYVNELILKEATGSPEELAKRLGISRRMVFNYVNHLQESHGRMICYCKIIRSYKYRE